MTRTPSRCGRLAVAFALLAALAVPAAEAETDGDGRVRLGYGRLITNDLFGDGYDRWRTGSVTTSRVWGYRWDGQPPARLGELLELRLQGQIIAPANSQRPAAGDRPFAGALSVGLHSHASRGAYDLSLGADMVLTGPQTGLDDLQDVLHDVFSMPKTSAGVKAQQIGDHVYPTVVAEAGREMRLGERGTLRPFVEARAGDETLVRLGADLTFGAVGLGELLVRESITGQRYRVISGEAPGLTFVLGADAAYVADSVYLPESRGYEVTHMRDRVRAGLHWQGPIAAAFYGVTWLGKEFDAQPEGQIVGSVRWQMQF